MKYGIIGLGKMGSILLDSLLMSDTNGIFYASCLHEENRRYKQNQYLNVKVTLDNKECVKNADKIFLCIHPNEIKEVLEEVKEQIKKNCTIVSIAAGLKIQDFVIDERNDINYVRILPNIPSSIHMGVNLICYGSKIDKSIEDLLKGMGKFYIINEEEMDVGSVTSGSLPAYVFKMISCYLQKAMEHGMDETLAKKLVCETLIGSASLYLKSNKTGQELIDGVCSKGGSTIEGIKTLDYLGFDKVIEECFESCLRKTRQLGK